MKQKVITITGGSGFVGQLLRAGLAEQGYDVRVFDRLRGPVVDMLRRRYLGTSQSRFVTGCATQIRGMQKKLESVLLRSGILSPSEDNIMASRSQIADRFRGSYAVIHLAGIPHPRMPGAVDADFYRLNYDGAINVFEAAREAGVARFLFASSGQVYGINKPIKIDQFPILESNYCPTLEEGQNLYGWLKLEFERYLDAVSADAGVQSTSLRLEFPGLLSKTPANFYISTSVENLVNGFIGALETRTEYGFEAVNLGDMEIRPDIVDVQEFLRRRWPDVPNHTTGNEALLSIAKARSILDYRPVRDGHYLPVSLAGP